MIVLESKNWNGNCNHVLIQGDCARIMCQVPHVDLIIADPPYFKVVGEKYIKAMVERYSLESQKSV